MGKYLCQSLLTCNFIKKETLAQVSSCEFCEIFKNTFFSKTPPVAVLDHVARIMWKRFLI